AEPRAGPGEVAAGAGGRVCLLAAREGTARNSVTYPSTSESAARRESRRVGASRVELGVTIGVCENAAAAAPAIGAVNITSDVRAARRVIIKSWALTIPSLLKSKAFAPLTNVR